MTAHNYNRWCERLCECGCGQMAAISSKTSTKRGYVKGQARRFANRHGAPSPLNRFWALVERPSDPDACWLWRGCCTTDGYGKFNVGEQKIRAHRFSYQVVYGPIPDGLFVCHRCDTPQCVRPDHLFLGTNHKNIIDAMTKGRFTHGERQHLAKLTADQVQQIRQARTAGQSLRQLAEEANVNIETVRAVVLGRTWKHLL